MRVAVIISPAYAHSVPHRTSCYLHNYDTVCITIDNYRNCAVTAYSVSADVHLYVSMCPERSQLICKIRHITEHRHNYRVSCKRVCKVQNFPCVCFAAAQRLRIQLTSISLGKQMHRQCFQLYKIQHK